LPNAAVVLPQQIAMLLDHLTSGLFERSSAAKSLQRQTKECRRMGVNLLSIDCFIVLKLVEDFTGSDQFLQH
jgi:hypothetical protein